MSSVKKKKINNFKVKAVNLSDVKEVYNLPVKGAKLGLGLLHNTFIVAPKNSGKSHLIYRILKATTTPETKIVIICPTHDKDPLYKKLIKDFTNKGYDISSYYEIDDILPQILEEDELEDAVKAEMVIWQAKLDAGYDPLKSLKELIPEDQWININPDDPESMEKGAEELAKRIKSGRLANETLH